MFQWQLKYFSASETGSHICDPRLGRVKAVNSFLDIYMIAIRVQMAPTFI